LFEAAANSVFTRLQADDDDSQRQQTLPGVGPIIAATVRAELGDVTRFQGVDQVIAYAGLDPRTHQSGAFIGQKHLSKRGPGALRHALYLATLNAVRNRAEWRDRWGLEPGHVFGVVAVRLRLHRFGEARIGRLGTPVLGGVFGTGCDAELSPSEVLARLAEVAAARGWSGCSTKLRPCSCS